MSNKPHILAKDVIIRAKKDDSVYYIFCAVNDMTLKIFGGIIETTSEGSGNWRHFVYDKKASWEASLKGVCVLSDIVDNSWTLNEIADIPVTFKTLEMDMTFTDSLGNLVTWTGTALMPDFDIAANMQDGSEPANWNVTIKGTGPLVKGALVPA